MLDYTKIKVQLDPTEHEVFTSSLNKYQEQENYNDNIEYDINYSDEMHFIDLRIQCLSIFESIKDITRDIYPPLFDKLTIEDLMELLDPEFVPKMNQINF